MPLIGFINAFRTTSAVIDENSSQKHTKRNQWFFKQTPTGIIHIPMRVTNWKADTKYSLQLYFKWFDVNFRILLDRIDSVFSSIQRVRSVPQALLKIEWWPFPRALHRALCACGLHAFADARICVFLKNEITINFMIKVTSEYWHSITWCALRVSCHGCSVRCEKIIGKWNEVKLDFVTFPQLANRQQLIVMNYTYFIHVVCY